MLKDIGLANGAAGELGGELPMARAAESLYQHAAAAGGETKDFGSIFQAVYGGVGVTANEGEENKGA